MSGANEQALRDALAFLEAIIDTIRDPLLVLDRDLRVVNVGREFYRTFRVAPEETEGKLVYELGNHQWDIPRLRTLLEEVLPRDSSFRDFEVEHVFEYIGRKVMLLNARKVYRQHNNSEQILLVIEDVTERRDAEEARREAETRFTEMVKNVRDHSIFLTDPGGVITSWNVAAERVIGYTEAEALGRHFSFIFTPEDLRDGLPERELREAREQGRAEDERWHVKKGGERFWALGIVTPLRDRGGRLTGFSKILRDITERKRMEDELRRSRDELEQRVRDRTAELVRSQERQLRAERLAVIGQTVTALAHEGRNALQRATACLARLVLRLQGQPEALDLVGRGQQALDDLERLFDDVRTYAAPVRLDYQACDVGRAWRQAWADVTARHAGRDAQLAEQSDVAGLECEADPFRLSQVFTNLFTNALEACPDPVRVAVSCRDSLLGERPALQISVRDNGPGFPEGQRRRPFEPFQTTKPTGTGLGLAITNRLVEAHGGEVALGEEPGAEVVLTLPRRRA
jgi:PAS domain S-box-containing protein